MEKKGCCIILAQAHRPSFWSAPAGYKELRGANQKRQYILNKQ